ncbi:MAG: hypothetical protein OXC63_08475 [Aestuariivita sp.]|nr:hypothetical protein [Aestuariivita sp.]MCY4345426.1 hypothetical protein [Aestuariivita sp.]
MYRECLRKLCHVVAMRLPRRNTVAAPHEGDADGVVWSALSGITEEDILYTSSETLLFSKVIARLRTNRETAAIKPYRWPQNLTPWSNELLPPTPPCAETLFGRLAVRWQWFMAHPQTRLQTSAWHHNERLTSKLRWRLHALRRTLRGMPTGSPSR